MEKGFGGVNRILKKQKEFAEETFIVLITDSPEPVDGCMRFTDKLMKKYDIKFEVIALNSYSAFVDESTGFRQFVAHNTQDLIEHIRLLAENQV